MFYLFKISRKKTKLRKGLINVDQTVDNNQYSAQFVLIFSYSLYLLHFLTRMTLLYFILIFKITFCYTSMFKPINAIPVFVCKKIVGCYYACF